MVEDIREQLPRWRQIELKLRDEIESGEIRPGDLLPSASALAANFGVNFHTVRRALGELQTAGLIAIQNGKRAKVQPDALNYSLHTKTRFTENIIEQGREPKTFFVRSSKFVAPGKIRRYLQLDAGSEIILLCVRAEADGVPISYGRNYLPADLFPDALADYKHFGSVTGVIRNRGFEMTERLGTRVVARFPTAEESNELCQGKTQPILSTEFVEAAPDGQRVRFALTAFSAARVQFGVGDVDLFDEDTAP